jgi:hypothetical protein
VATSLPNRAHLGPFVYAITDRKRDWKRLAPGDMDTHWGLTLHAEATILLNPQSSPALQRVTLLHELLHAAAFAGGQLDTRKRTEEQWVAMTAPQLLDCLRRSPEVAAYLLGDE